MKPTKRFTTFACEKYPAVGSRAMVVTNHPLASAAGAEILLGGGNAVDAAVAALFALTVVEPMMVGVLGGGIAHIRPADGRHVVIDALSTAPASAHDAMYETVSDELPRYRDTVGRANAVGPLAVAVPGALAGWCRALDDFGTLSVADVTAPAIRLAERGFAATPYLADCVADLAADLVRDPGLTALFLPGGAPLAAGHRVVQPEYAEALRAIAKDGPRALYGGALGAALADAMSRTGGLVRREDLDGYRVIEREPIRGTYRGFEILGPPPPASSGVHVVQMLNLLEGFDMRGMGFGSADTLHLLTEAMKIAFADRAVATADPAFVDVPVERLTDKGYADERRRLIDSARAQRWEPGVLGGESSCTTHVTVADVDGNVVATTQTINGLFGACVQVPGTGMIANNYMFNFDPHPGRALSVEPGKRVFTSMAPMMVRRDGRLLHALGLPGGLRIFPSAMQALANLLDHEMTLQEAVEAPRIWTEGGVVEMEGGFSEEVANELVGRGHEVARMQRIGGGMNAIAFDDDGTLTGAACWRADGTPVGIAGGLARPGVRFSGT
ncbi:MAG: gamma-glutamyltransferase [Chromatiales bacterium]|nr:gamma-glutamyltransferase [Chromatiales bacterium]